MKPRWSLKCQDGGVRVGMSGTKGAVTLSLLRLCWAGRIMPSLRSEAGTLVELWCCLLVGRFVCSGARQVPYEVRSYTTHFMLRLL